MSTTATRWTRNAVVARLAASDAIDHDTVSTLRVRAESRLELLRIMSAVEGGHLDAASAEALFETIRTAHLALSA
ncbi:hypothetical protein [Frondihabitans australicus]|uniref:Uncharacterized protein n=1 Tax=Frondihabitans australicus TaxID=386892 RepID=A0A495IHE6_9MICO|nr:hypothetical protein [Frondihabitans australicus]RKR74575.1 hypothetical protein C8E83_1694 [Frondihabitans australicus]